MRFLFKITAAKNTPYSELLKAAGVNPYLWMAFIAPNAANADDCYEVCLWPDKSGQLVAVVQNNLVLSCEYQPNGIVLPAAEADGETPRAPRYLAADPANGNDVLKNYAMFKKFAALTPGQTEADVRSKLGDPAATDDSDASMLTLTYAVADAAFSTGETTYTFVFDKTSGKLIAKSAVALSVGDDEILGRYAAQMLPGMSHDDIEDFMGKALITNQSLSTTDDLLNTYTYAGSRAAVSAVFPKDVDACLWNEAVVNDSEAEFLTLYEEYVIPVEPSKPKATPSKTAGQTPQPTLPNITLIPVPTPTLPTITNIPRKTPQPTLWVPTITLPNYTIIPRVTPTPVPTPTPVIIK